MINGTAMRSTARYEEDVDCVAFMKTPVFPNLGKIASRFFQCLKIQAFQSVFWAARALFLRVIPARRQLYRGAFSTMLCLAIFLFRPLKSMVQIKSDVDAVSKVWKKTGVYPFTDFTSLRDPQRFSCAVSGEI